MAEAVNKFFITIGCTNEMPPTNVEPDSYLQPTDKVFTLKVPNVITVSKLLGGMYMYVCGCMVGTN